MNPASPQGSNSSNQRQRPFWAFIMFVVAHTVEFIETKREMPTSVIVHVACIRSGYELGRKEPVTDSSNAFAPRI